MVSDGDLVEWTSYGYLADGRTFDIGEYEVKIGAGEAPKGLEEGLKGLCLSDERCV